MDLNVVDAMVIAALATVMDDRDFYRETMTEAAAMRIVAMVREVRREAPKPLGDLIHIESGVIHYVPADTLYRALMVVHPDRVATAQFQSLVAACKGVSVAALEQGCGPKGAGIKHTGVSVPDRAPAFRLVLYPPAWISRLFVRIRRRRRR